AGGDQARGRVGGEEVEASNRLARTIATLRDLLGAVVLGARLAQIVGAGPGDELVDEFLARRAVARGLELGRGVRRLEVVEPSLERPGGGPVERAAIVGDDAGTDVG